MLLSKQEAIVGNVVGDQGGVFIPPYILFDDVMLPCQPAQQVANANLGTVGGWIGKPPR